LIAVGGGELLVIALDVEILTLPPGAGELFRDGVDCFDCGERLALSDKEGGGPIADERLGRLSRFGQAAVRRGYED